MFKKPLSLSKLIIAVKMALVILVANKILRRQVEYAISQLIA
jgi:hypothetical protein